MRVLIVTAALLACACAVPSGLLAHGYAHAPLAYAHAGPLAVAHAAPVLAHAAIAPALPTISSGDLQGAAIEAHVDASDHARAAVDAAREYHDQASELHGQAINAAEDHSWQAVDAVKTHEAQLDGAAAGAAPILAKQLAGHVSPVVHAAYAAPLAHGYAAPLAHGYAAPLAHGYAAPLAHGYAAPLAHGYAAPLAHGYAAHGYAAPAIAHAASKTVVSQSLHQSHPAPVVHAPVYAHAPVAYGAHAGLAPHGYAHAW